MVHSSSAESWIETLGTQRFQVFDNPGPQMKNVVPKNDIKSQTECVKKLFRAY